MSGQITFEGTIENVIYRSEKNGYTVFTVIPAENTQECFPDGEKPSQITCTATMPDISPGENFKLCGIYVLHPTYGRQFNVGFFERVLPTGIEAIVNYLGSGLIKGIGEKLAHRIVDKFGTNTLLIIEESPEKLSEVRGISVAKAYAIGDIFREQSTTRHIMMFLQKFGISAVFSQKIYKKYKDNTIKTLETNPYVLAEDIHGIGFKTADMIAARLGIGRGSVFRIKAGIKFVLSEALLNGHVFLPRTVLIQNAKKLLGVVAEQIETIVTELSLDRDIHEENFEGENVAYLNMYYYMEMLVAKKLVGLCTNTPGKTDKVYNDIKRIELETGISLAQNQKQAVAEALSNGVLVITGGPGTGKTTTINTIISLLKEEKYSIELAAPTGRAAKRMTEATGIEAKTIHRLLGSEYSEKNEKQAMYFSKNKDSPLETDVVIIDESSMVDITLMYHLLEAVPLGAKLILVGDVDQLPSVGPGNVLKDIISSNIIPVVRLVEIFRQAQESAIVMNAHRINNGERPVLNEKGKDFFFLKRAWPEDVASAIVELITQRLPNFNNYDPIKDIQVLTPMRKSIIGVNELNPLLQQALNPPHPSKAEKEMRSLVYREGDKVMQIKNNYNMVWRIYDSEGNALSEGTGVFNGDEGTVVGINDIAEYIKVKFDDERVVFYDYSQLDELELSYAITIHKSQGSEYKVIIIPVHSGPPMLMSRNLLYTAVTRAKELAVIVGVPEMLYQMVDNNRQVNRYTALCARIQRFGYFIKEL